MLQPDPKSALARRSSSSSSLAPACHACFVAHDTLKSAMPIKVNFHFRHSAPKTMPAAKPKSTVTAEANIIGWMLWRRNRSDSSDMLSASTRSTLDSAVPTGDPLLLDSFTKGTAVGGSTIEVNKATSSLKRIVASKPSIADSSVSMTPSLIYMDTYANHSGDWSYVIDGKLAGEVPSHHIPQRHLSQEGERVRRRPSIREIVLETAATASRAQGTYGAWSAAYDEIDELYIPSPGSTPREVLVDPHASAEFMGGWLPSHHSLEWGHSPSAR